MRARLMQPRRHLAVLAAAAVLAGACGTVPSSAVAVVGGTEVSMDEFGQLVSARMEGLGLEGRQLELAREAVQLGMLGTAAIRQQVGDAINGGQVSESDLPDLPAGLVDDLLASEREAMGGEYQQALDQLGVSDQEWREVYEAAAEQIVAGIQFFGQQAPPEIPLDRASYVDRVQTSTLTELVSMEVTRQRFDALDLELDPGEIDSQRESIRSSFASEEQFQAALDNAGYESDEQFDELVRHQLRQQALQDPANGAEELDPIEVEVAGRFGEWDAQQQQVVPPADD